MQMKTEAKKEKFHEPVLAREVIQFLEPRQSRRFIDATLGTAGHSLEIVKNKGAVLGIETDPSIISVAEERLKETCPQKDCFKLVQGNFRKIDEIAESTGFKAVSGILFDLGVNNIQLTDPQRGFSFGSPEVELDMRLNAEDEVVTAADLLNALRLDQLRNLFESTLDPGAALWLSRRVVAARENGSIKTVGDFLSISRGLRTKPGINPATLPMLALRIAVNSELENLKEALPKAFGLLGKEGRLVVISFHSGEDRIVKEFFKEMEGSGAAILTKDVVVPTEKEIRENPRARSAKMRVLEKND